MFVKVLNRITYFYKINMMEIVDMKNYFEEIKYFFENKLYIISTAIMAVLSYGYAAVNTSIGTDDIRGELEIGAGKQVIASGRFSQAIWPYLFGYKTEWIENSFVIDVLAVIILLWASVNCCILFRKIAKELIPDAAYVVFSCLMITYPLIHEIWEYTHINLCVCIGIFLDTVALLIMYKWIKSRAHINDLLVVSFLLMIVCSGYESTVCVYIFLVFAILLLSTLFQHLYSVKQLLKEGCIYAGVLIFAIFLRLIVHYFIILHLFHVPYDGNGATGIVWGEDFISTLWSLIVGWIDSYLLKGIIYFPLTEILVSIVIHFGLIIYLWRKNQKINILISGLGMLFSLVALSLLQGIVTFYRSCQVFAFFIAFTGMLFFNVIYQKRKQASYTLAGILLFICLIQAFYLNRWLTLNHFRSNEEITVIKTIGNDLMREYDLDKPVVILGEYNLSDYIIEAKSINKNDVRWKIYCHVYSWMHKKDYSIVYNEKSRILSQTDVNSVITWATSDQIDIFNLFRMQGIDYVFPSDEILRLKAEEYIQTHFMPEYPQDGYIADAGEFIVIYIH